MTKFLLIEGLPGSGKSSIAAALAKEFEVRQLPHHLFLEADKLNPFRFENGTSAEVTVDAFLTTIQRQWETIAKQALKTEGTVIQEGMTFQQQVNFLTWVNCQEKISATIESIFNSMSSFEMKLIYLRNQDSRKALVYTMDIRGEKWINEKVKVIDSSPFALDRKIKFPEAAFQFVSEVQKVTDDLFEATLCKKLKIDVTSRNWESIRQTASAFIFD